MDCVREWFVACGQFCKKYVTVEPVIFLYMIAIFMEVSITQDLMSSKNCLKYTNITSFLNCSDLNHNERLLVKNETTKWISYYSGCMFAFTLIAASYVGSWSDKFNYKFTMLIPPIGSIFATVMAIFNGYYIHWPIGLILISGFFSGISGGIVALIASSIGYIVRITSFEERTKRIVISEAMIFLGATVGMLSGGGINKYIKENHPKINSYGVVYGFELILLVLVVLYITLRIKDTRMRETTNQLEENSVLYQLFNINHIRDSVEVIFKRRNNDLRMVILLLLLVSFLTDFSISIQSTLLYVFLSSEPLEYDQTKYSYYQGASFAVSGLGLIVGLPIAIKLLRTRDTTLAIAGEFSKMFGLVLLGLSKTNVEVYLTAALFVFSEFPIPVIRSIYSKIIPADETGKIFAIMQLLQNFCMLISSQLFNWLFVVTSKTFPGVGFEIVAAFQCIAIILLFYLRFKFKIDTDQDNPVPYDTLNNGGDPNLIDS